LHFGENYTQELTHKAALLPRSIRWHFIGALQTNKCRPLAEGIENLWAVESVDTTKKADALEKGRKALRDRLQQDNKKREKGESEDVGPLRVYVQVNTSGEESKSGVEPSDASQLARYIVDDCPNLKLQGLMTIGAIARSQAAAEGEENEDFVTLKNVRRRVTEDLGWGEDKLELSMGMSADYEDAIRQGSDEVRVGTGIFGSRPQKSG
jgi:PLP dependent protein